MTEDVCDAIGTILSEGDAVSVIKDRKVEGTSQTVKRGCVINGIHLTDDTPLLESRVEKIKGIVLRTKFLKKA